MLDVSSRSRVMLDTKDQTLHVPSLLVSRDLTHRGDTYCLKSAYFLVGIAKRIGGICSSALRGEETWLCARVACESNSNRRSTRPMGK